MAGFPPRGRPRGQRARRRLLPDAAADAFCLRGGPAQISRQILDIVRAVSVPVDHIVLHPIPDPRFPDDPERGYTARVALEILPAVRAALA
jgi:hypothetical protein